MWRFFVKKPLLKGPLQQRVGEVRRTFQTHVTSPTIGAAVFHTQVAVIGAGVLGLAIARVLAQAGNEVLLLEKASQVASETSSRNSEVIHAGIYYPSHSHKAKLCVRGKELLYQYCQERSITHRRCGKLVVATSPSQLDSYLPQLRDQAHANGVTDVTILRKEDVKVLEPEIVCEGALLSPSSGVLDSHSYYLQLLADCEDAGVTLALQTTIADSKLYHDHVLLQTYNTTDVRDCIEKDGRGEEEPSTTWISCNTVVNAAGLWASQIATMIHQDIVKTSAWQPPRHYFAKGTYFSLQGIKPPNFRHLVYPVPEPGGLGVHATLDWSASNRIKFGPDVEWLQPDDDDDDDDDGTTLQEISYIPDASRGDTFYTAIRRYWPDLPDGSLVADYVGIRPKLSHPDLHHPLGFDDFAIVGPATHGIPNVIHLLGMESPGLTSSLAIAEYVKDKAMQ